MLGRCRKKLVIQEHVVVLAVEMPRRVEIDWEGSEDTRLSRGSSGCQNIDMEMGETSMVGVRAKSASPGRLHDLLRTRCRENL